MPRRKTETNLRKRVVDGLKKQRCDAVAVEDQYDTGRPDVNYCSVHAGEGWIELKVIDKWPAKPTTTVHTKLRHYTNEQINWAIRRVQHGGTVYMLLYVMATKEYLLFEGEDGRKIKNATQEELYKLAIVCYRHHIPYDDLHSTMAAFG